MYQFSRAIYRELADHIDDGHDGREQVLHAAEACIERLASDRQHFARPARTLFNDVRVHFAMGDQGHVWRVIAAYISLADRWLADRPVSGRDAYGNLLTCRATTRRGTPCQRGPLAADGYCPSHRHLAETEDIELLAAA